MNDTFTVEVLKSIGQLTEVAEKRMQLIKCNINVRLRQKLQEPSGVLILQKNLMKQVMLKIVDSCYYAKDEI